MGISNVPAFAACLLSNCSSKWAPHWHEKQVSKCCVAASVGAIVPTVTWQIDGETQADWTGYKFPVRTPGPLQMQSGRDEGVHTSSTHPALFLRCGCRGTWIHFCHHRAQWRPLGKVGHSAVLPQWLRQWICAEGKTPPVFFASCFCVLLYVSLRVFPRLWGISKVSVLLLTVAYCMSNSELLGKRSHQNYTSKLKIWLSTN